MDNENVFSRATGTNVAVWVLITASAAFLSARLWCRHHFAKLWWDDAVLTVSWLLLLIGGAFISRIIAVGAATDADKHFFFRYQNASVQLTTIATSWTKVAFAITLTRIARHKVQLCFIWAIVATANLVLIPGTVSTWIPACGDPRARFRPIDKLCWKLETLQYLGGVTMVYGGVIDILLALFPWLILRKTQLGTREKIGIGVAMSLGALTGVVVVLRAFFQLVQGDYNFDFMLHMSIFGFLEPCVTIIAQAIPMLRALVISTKRGHNAQKSSGMRISALMSLSSSNVSRSASVGTKPSSSLESKVGNGRGRMSNERWDGGFGEPRHNDLRV